MFCTWSENKSFVSLKTCLFITGKPPLCAIPSGFPMFSLSKSPWGPMSWYLVKYRSQVTFFSRLNRLDPSVFLSKSINQFQGVWGAHPQSCHLARCDSALEDDATWLGMARGKPGRIFNWAWDIKIIKLKHSIERYWTSIVTIHNTWAEKLVLFRFGLLTVLYPKGRAAEPRLEPIG